MVSHDACLEVFCCAGVVNVPAAFNYFSRVVANARGPCCNGRVEGTYVFLLL